MDEPVDAVRRRVCKCLTTFIIKCFLIITTATCVLGGIVIIFGSIWLMTDQSAAEDLEQQEGIRGIRIAAGIFLMGGLAVCAINGTGLAGAFFQKPKLLLAFIILVGVLLVFPEIVIIIWFVVNHGQVVALTDEVLSRNLRGFMMHNQKDAKIFMANIQSTLHCCGFNGISDYLTDLQRDTCKSPDPERKYYITGCKHNLAQMFAENLMIIGTIEIFHLIISIFTMVAAWKLRKQIMKAMEEGVEQAEDVHLEKVTPIENSDIKFENSAYGEKDLWL